MQLNIWTVGIQLAIIHLFVQKSSNINRNSPFFNFNLNKDFENNNLALEF